MPCTCPYSSVFSVVRLKRSKESPSPSSSECGVNDQMTQATNKGVRPPPELPVLCHSGSAASTYRVFFFHFYAVFVAILFRFGSRFLTPSIFLRFVLFSASSLIHEMGIVGLHVIFVCVRLSLPLFCLVMRLVFSCVAPMSAHQLDISRDIYKWYQQQ